MATTDTRHYSEILDGLVRDGHITSWAEVPPEAIVLDAEPMPYLAEGVYRADVHLRVMDHHHGRELPHAVMYSERIQRAWLVSLALDGMDRDLIRDAVVAEDGDLVRICGRTWEVVVPSEGHP